MAAVIIVLKTIGWIYLAGVAINLLFFVVLGGPPRLVVRICGSGLGRLMGLLLKSKTHEIRPGSCWDWVHSRYFPSMGLVVVLLVSGGGLQFVFSLEGLLFVLAGPLTAMQVFCPLLALLIPRW